MATNKISTHARDDSVCNSVARVWPPWLEGRCQASNVAVVAGDLFATPNPLTSHTEKNLLSPFSNIRAIMARLCTRSRLAILEDYWPLISAVAQAVAAASFNPASMRSHSRPVLRARSRHATSQNPQDSKIYLPGFHRFKFEFHSFFGETFSTVSAITQHSLSQSSISSARSIKDSGTSIPRCLCGCEIDQ